MTCPDVRVITPFEPFTTEQDRIVAQAKMTGRIQVRKSSGDDHGDMWLLALPDGRIHWISVIAALADPYVSEAIGYTPDMSNDRVAWLLGIWHANHVAWCSTVRSSSDADGVGIIRKEPA